MGIMDRLKNKSVRNSTARNYFSIWRTFNKFLVRLDRLPRSCEERTALYCTFLIENGNQSSTVKSCVSAIKATLRWDGYAWDDNQILIESLIKACRLKNDHVSYRFPIRVGLLETLLFEVQRQFLYSGQTYLDSLYKAIFSLAYYGLMRIGELMEGEHTMKAKDIHIARNKNKIMIVLHSSKTHGKNKQPQKIKITGLDGYDDMTKHRFFCPFSILRHFVDFRGGYWNEEEQFFIFRDSARVKPVHVRTVLCQILKKLNLNPNLYNTHSFRSGRLVDMLKYGKSLAEIKAAGRWHSNAVYRYLQN